jgi:hypothetical protein
MTPAHRVKNERLSLELEKRILERRTYRIEADGFFVTLEREYENFQATAPDPTRNAPVYDSKSRTLIYSDMCVQASGGQAALAEEWGLLLPEDYLEFCRDYGEYVLAGRCPVHILSSYGIRMDTSGIRDAWDVPRGTPHRLFCFAHIGGEPGCFAFRWSRSLETLDIVIIDDYGVVGEPDLLGPDGDQYVTDPDFTSWLRRMIDTDCYPMAPGRKEPDHEGLIRIQ